MFQCQILYATNICILHVVPRRRSGSILIFGPVTPGGLCKTIFLHNSGMIKQKKFWRQDFGVFKYYKRKNCIKSCVFLFSVNFRMYLMHKKIILVQQVEFKQVENVISRGKKLFCLLLRMYGTERPLFPWS